MRKSSHPTQNYRQNALPHAARVANFQQQMSDFARGERLRTLRRERQLSQEDAAHEIGVSVKTIRAWEKGSGIRPRNAKAAGRFYKVEPASLVDHELGLASENGSSPQPEGSATAEQLREARSEIAELRGELSEVRTALSRVESLLRRGEHGQGEAGS